MLISLRPALFSFFLLESPEKRKLQLRNRIHYIGQWAHLPGIFLTKDWCGKTHPTVGRDPLGKVALGCTRKECDKDQRSQPPEQCSSVVSASVSAQALALTSLQDGLQAVRPLNPLLPKVLLVSNKKRQTRPTPSLSATGQHFSRRLWGKCKH